MDVAILVYDGFNDLDAIGPFEAFNHAAHAGADLSVGLFTREGQDHVRSVNGLRIVPDGTLPESPDLLVVPGGGWDEEEGAKLPGALESVHQTGTTVSSVCTGVFLLARAGITDGRPATTHHQAVEELEASGAEVREARVVDDGDLVTAGGVTAGIDLALHLIEREVGSDVAEDVADMMEYEPGEEAYSG